MSARVEYTIEVRGQPVRRAIEVDVGKVERIIDKLTDKGGFNFDVKYEVEVIRPPSVPNLPEVRVPTPLPGKMERITERPPSMATQGYFGVAGIRMAVQAASEGPGYFARSGYGRVYEAALVAKERGLLRYDATGAFLVPTEEGLEFLKS